MIKVCRSLAIHLRHYSVPNVSVFVKKLSSGLTAKTERNLAERAGHLELLKGTKKDKGKEKAAGKK